MTSQENQRVICPESTIESANRRNFIRKAALATAAAGVSGAILGNNIISESHAKSSECVMKFCGQVYIMGQCPACAPFLVYGAPGQTGNLQEWGKNCFYPLSAVNSKGAFGIGTGTGSLCCFMLNVTAPNQQGILIKGPHSGIGSGLNFISTSCGINVMEWEILNTGASAGQGANKLNIRNDTYSKDLFTICASSSFIGINTTTPSETLDVKGTILGCSTGTGVLGKGNDYGVQGCSACGTGVYGKGKQYGLQGCSSPSGTGVHGISCSGPGVFGISSSRYGVHGCSSDNIGVYGNGPKYGVQGSSTGLGDGVFGCSPCGTGVQGSSKAGNGVYGCSTTSFGVRGVSASGPGVYGCSSTCSGVWGFSCKIGVLGQSGSKTGIGVEGQAVLPCTIPIVAKGAVSQKASLQEWQNSCGTVFAVVNAAGSLGLGGVTSPNHVLCISGKAHASAGFGIATSCINTTLAVNGSMAVRTRAVTASTTLLTTDFAILASGAITLTLPAAGTQNGMMIFIKNVSTSTITIKPGGTDTIEGAASSSPKTLGKQYDSLQLISNGSNEWFIVGSVKCGAVIS